MLRSLLLPAKIAFVFSLVTLVLLAGALILFLRVAGDDVAEEYGLLRAYQGVELAERLETELGTAIGDGARLERWLEEQEARLDLSLRVVGEDGSSGLGHAHRRAHWIRTVEVGGRACRLIGPPLFQSRVPLADSAGSEQRWLVVAGGLHTAEAHRTFVLGLLQLGLVTLVMVAGLTYYLTRPLRRMGRSMDRIAAGDLEHRVAARGSGDVAAMGRSFNAMADRIGTMLTGQKELMAGVSHELRSPLTRMKLALELLRERPADARRHEELEREIDAVDALVEELLLASRFELGAVPIRSRRLDLEALCRRAWQRVAEPAARVGAELEVDPGEAAGFVAADESLAVRLLGNLFENAVRYAGGGRVRVASRRRGDRVEIEVSDDGPGVRAEHLGKLFEPFFRTDRSRSRRTGASGLGLMIVRRAVEAHGGRVEARANDPRGLTVAFDLPAA